MQNSSTFEKWEGFDSIRIFNSEIGMRFLPELGCKIAQVTDLADEFEWLWRDSSRPYKRRNFADRFDEHDISGFDECFPNIGISPNPEDLTSQLPDHGELWCQPWVTEIVDGSIISNVESQLFNYSFQRTVKLNERKISFEYEIRNRSSRALMGFWSAHPLFNVSENMRIEISGNPQMTKEFGFSGRLGNDGVDGYEGHLDPYIWPFTLGSDGLTRDLSIVSLVNPITDKVVLRSPEDGRVAIFDPASNHRLEIEFDSFDLPYLGICFNLGAYPKTGVQGRWLAIEPSSGATDRLDEAVGLGLKAIRPGEVQRWSTTWHLGSQSKH